jgi:integrase
MRYPIQLPVSADDAAKLARHASRAKGAYSKATERAVRADTAIFADWCIKHGCPSLPAGPETIAAFVDDMATTRKPATVARYISSIAHLHRAAGRDNPGASETVRLALKRMRRGNGIRQRQAAPLNRKEINRILDSLGDGLRDRRDAALISTGYDTLARRSEIAAMNSEDFTFTDDGTGTVLIGRSKTDQEGAGDTRFLAHDTCNSIKAWFEVASITEGPAFLGVRRGDIITGRLEPGDIARIYKRRAKAVGIDPTSISGHSMRVGAAQDLVAADLGVADIMQSGGWKTPRMIARYTEHQQARRGAMAKLAARQNRL